MNKLTIESVYRGVLILTALACGTLLALNVIDHAAHQRLKREVEILQAAQRVLAMYVAAAAATNTAPSTGRNQFGDTYRYDAASEAPPDGDMVVMPPGHEGPGRWIKTSTVALPLNTEERKLPMTNLPPDLQ